MLRKHDKPSQAYAAAATKVCEELALLAKSIEGKDCREATWSQAEELHALAARLEELRKQFKKGGA